MGQYASLVPLLGMLAVFALNHRVTYRRTYLQTNRNGSRLRAALTAELTLLHEMVEGNLRLIGDGEEYLLSARAMMSVYRGSVGRLDLLTEPEIAAVVRAYGAVEAMEAFIAGSTKPHGGHAYKALHGEAPFEEIKRRCADVCTGITAALVRLEEGRMPTGLFWPLRVQRPEVSEAKVA